MNKVEISKAGNKKNNSVEPLVEKINGQWFVGGLKVVAIMADDSGDCILSDGSKANLRSKKGA
jgi:hypothetical protein